MPDFAGPAGLRKESTMDLKEQILRTIDRNSKLSMSELALMLGREEAEVTAAVAEMEADKVICGYPTLINWDKVSNEKITALIEVKVTPQRGQGFDKIAERIYKFSEVETVYLMSGGFDLTVIIKGKSHFVLKKYKEHSIIMEQEDEDERMMVSP